MAVETAGLVQLEREGAVATVRLNRPEALNAINLPMQRELVAALDSLRGDESVRAVILTGAGRAFNAGADVRQMRETEFATTAQVRTVVQQYGLIISGITELEVPVIAAVGGVAAGIGFSLVMACDLVVAGRSARFIQAFAQLGLIPDGGSTWLLPRQIGMARAKELIFSMRPLEAPEARELGIVNQVVDDDQVEAVAQGLAAQLATGPTRAYGAAKRLVNQSARTDLATALDSEAALQAICFATDDAREGVSAFLEKRRPSFTGR
ncbi:MAG: enoyl-CoA hydratase/isomerase family protein [Candidatus Dormibacteria bacterium]